MVTGTVKGEGDFDELACRNADVTVGDDFFFLLLVVQNNFGCIVFREGFC